MQDNEQEPNLLQKIKELISSFRTAYSFLFVSFNFHHMFPRSRGGKTEEFNLFPFFTKAHTAWHVIFLNLTIMEVWTNLESIYKSIFEADDEMIKMKWLLDCKLESGSANNPVAVEDFKRQVNRLAKGKGMAAERLRQKWFVCFGGTDLHQAEAVIKMMMLVMVFGRKIADQEWLFDNGNIDEFVSNLPAGPRSWAFRNCFNSPNIGHRGIKAMIRKILDSYPHY